VRAIVCSRIRPERRQREARPEPRDAAGFHREEHEARMSERMVRQFMEMVAIDSESATRPG
jgi:hypothetical protein